MTTTAQEQPQQSKGMAEAEAALLEMANSGVKAALKLVVQAEGPKHQVEGGSGEQTGGPTRSSKPSAVVSPSYSSFPLKAPRKAG